MSLEYAVFPFMHAICVIAKYRGMSPIIAVFLSLQQSLGLSYLSINSLRLGFLQSRSFLDEVLPLGGRCGA